MTLPVLVDDVERARECAKAVLEYGGEGFDVSDIIAATELISAYVATVRREAVEECLREIDWRRTPAEIAKAIRSKLSPEVKP